MKTASIYETKAHFSAYVKLAKQGQEIVVTERGTPVVKLVAFTAERLSPEETIEKLTREGVLVGGGVPFPKNFKGVKRPGALKRFLEDRE